MGTKTLWQREVEGIREIAFNQPKKGYVTKGELLEIQKEMEDFYKSSLIFSLAMNRQKGH